MRGAVEVGYGGLQGEGWGFGLGRSEPDAEAVARAGGGRWDGDRTGRVEGVSVA